MNIYFPTETTFGKNEDIPLLSELTRVVPLYNIPISRRVHLENYHESIQSVINSMLPTICLEYAEKIRHMRDVQQKRLFYKSIFENCPLIEATFYSDEPSATLSISTLCKSGYTREVGRFICDYFTKWLLPGKSISLSHVHSAVIQFEQSKGRGLFFHEMFIEIEDARNLAAIKANLPDLIHELKINIVAVSHARRVVSANTLTDDQKRIIVQENISELLDIPSKGYNHNLFEQMQHFLLKASSEEKIATIKKNLAPLIDLNPQVFERDLFNEIQRFILPTKKRFSTERKLSYVTKIISYSYLLRKRAAYAFNSNPSERFAVSKILRSFVHQDDVLKPVIGVLVAVNFSSESELFDERHLLAALTTLIPEAVAVKDSIIHNKREYTGTRIIYLEIEKPSESFTKEEVKVLQERLTDRIISRIESVTNTVFMPRNEEEVLRNILTLNNQIKFPTDLPQVMINFQAQENVNLLFTVIIVRVEHPELKPILPKIKGSEGSIYIQELEIKTVGRVRKKTPKKAYILEIICPKKEYLRVDFSLDLTRARRDVFSFVSNIAGEVRDFNGGMIAKQNEVLVELKRQLLQNNYTDEFSLENFFYSFTPRFMQCILPATSLKHSFLFLQEALEHDFSKCIYFIKTITWERHFIITVSTINQSFRDFIEEEISQIDFDPSSLATSYTTIHDIPILSYILRFSDCSQSDILLKTLVEGIKTWKKSIL
jgi:hypothetical protein